MSSESDYEPSWIIRFSDIEHYRQMGSGASGWWVYASRVHHVPTFYKYDWWIFWEGAPADGDELIFDDRYRMSTSQASALYVRLQKEGKAFFIYNRRRPRLDPENPFDPNAERWKGCKWAPSLAEDPDPIVQEGPWKGHK